MVFKKGHESYLTEESKKKISVTLKKRWVNSGNKVNCIVCNKEIRRADWEVKDRQYHFCSIECRGKYMSTRTKEKHPLYKGRWKTSDRYILIHLPEHPFADKAGYVKEHRLIVEKKIGRYLTKEEVIHHMDEVRDNNDIDNLMIFPNSSQHTKWHTAIRQHGITRPMQRIIENRWETQSR